MRADRRTHFNQVRFDNRQALAQGGEEALAIRQRVSKLQKRHGLACAA